MNATTAPPTTTTGEALAALMGEDETPQNEVQSLTILPGTDKSGRPEGFEELSFRAGEVVCIVGATGSGKSRFLADIE